MKLFNQKWISQRGQDIFNSLFELIAGVVHPENFSFLFLKISPLTLSPVSH